MPTKRFKDLSGMVYGQLLVVSFSHYDNYGGSIWLCRCVSCGSETTKKKYALVSGHSKSCGCKKRGLPQKDSNRLHGMSDTKFYWIWSSMLYRCYGKNGRHYKDYGGRGIVVCDRWQLFQNFYEDMFYSYQEKLTIDRIDVNGNYEPLNCRWITIAEQNKNKRNSVYVVYNGEKIRLRDLSSKLGISFENTYRRIKNGWSVELAISILPSHSNLKLKLFK